MKFWIRLLTATADKLDTLIEKEDDAIERVALDVFGNTAAQCREILRLTENKRRLIKLQVLYGRLEAGLPEDAFSLLVRYGRGASLSELADALSIHRQTVYKRLNAACKAAARLLAADKVTPETLAEEYDNMLPLPLSIK
ncbi:MAG: hypothetical protein LBH24_04015 [Clostridiales bacterium]|jgi:predicted DNA-binding protein YlxM (UPF0122 family)|nr:hypothetical protein [Clostridiales bacterium]